MTAALLTTASSSKIKVSTSNHDILHIICKHKCAVNAQMLKCCTGGKNVSAWHDIPLWAEDGLLNFICEIPKESSAKMEVATVRKALASHLCLHLHQHVKPVGLDYMHTYTCTCLLHYCRMKKELQSSKISRRASCDSTLTISTGTMGCCHRHGRTQIITILMLMQL